jgi:hypothetical protein
MCRVALSAIAAVGLKFLKFEFSHGIMIAYSSFLSGMVNKNLHWVSRLTRMDPNRNPRRYLNGSRHIHISPHIEKKFRAFLDAE